MKIKKRNSKGSISAIITMGAVGAIATLLILFLLMQASVLNAIQNNQTAAEAASLFAARELCSITVPTKFGELGLVDLSPTDKRNPFAQGIKGKANEVPVIGVNTAFATIRLDMQIAFDLKNKAMQDLAIRDLVELRGAAQALRAALTKAVSQRGPGTIHERTLALYQKNTGPNQGKVIPDSLTITLGTLRNNSGTTNIPLPPAPDSADLADSTGGFFRPYKPLIVAGNYTFLFAAIGKEPRLVSNNDFQTADGQGANVNPVLLKQLPQSVVQIKAEHEVINPVSNSVAPNVKDSALATAEAGGALLSTRPTVYSVGFAGSFPSTKNFFRLTLRSLLDFDGWQRSTDGTWLRNFSPDFQYPRGNGGEGTLASQDFRDPSMASTNQTPDVALAYGIYDWLKSLRLKPNRQEVVKLINEIDLRQLVVEANKRKYVGPSKIDGRPDDADGPEADQGEGANIQDPTEKGSPLAPVDLVNNFRGSMTGTIFRETTSGIDARLAALRGTEQGGPELYADAFDFRSIDALKGGEQSPQTSPAIGSDFTTGAATSVSGQNASEVVQFVQGVIATNRAALTSRIAGRMALVEALQAEVLLRGDANNGVVGNAIAPTQGNFDAAFKQHKANQKIRLATDGIKEPRAIVKQLSQPTCVREVFEDVDFIRPFLTSSNASSRMAAEQALKEAAVSLRNLLNSYLATSVIRNSPVNAKRQMMGLTPFLSLNLQGLLPGEIIRMVDNVRPVTNAETVRIAAIRRRGEQCLLNGQIAYARTNNLLRRLKRFTAHGVRRLINEGSNAAPAFAINMLNPEIPADPAKPNTRVVYLMPNNGRTINRILSGTAGNFYNTDLVSRQQADNFKVSIEQVKESDSGQIFVPDQNRLTSGAEIMPLQVAAGSQELVPPGGINPSRVIRDRRYSWDTASDEDRSDLGRYAMRYFKKKHVRGGANLTRQDMELNSIDFIQTITRAQLRTDAAKARTNLQPNIEFTDGGISGQQQERDVPATESVFLLACKGNATEDFNNGGKFEAIPVSPSIDQQTRYPFGNTNLPQEQYLYFSANALKEGATGSISTNRSVIARDLFANLQRGVQFNLQEARNWCKRYNVNLPSDNNSDPYLAGEFRIGNPIATVKEPAPAAFDIRIDPSLRTAPELVNESALNTIDVLERDDYEIFPPISVSKRKQGIFGIPQEKLGEAPAPAKLPI